MSLVAAVVLEQRRPDETVRARAIAAWGLALTSALAWLFAPGSLSAYRVDTGSGLAGMLGWALFALACAAPMAKRDDASDARIVEGPPLRPRTRLARGDLAIVSLGAVLACALQAVGWSATPVERGVLVRVTVLACGLAVLGASTSVALARHTRRVPAPRRERVKRALPWFVLAGALAIAGVALALLGAR